MKLSTTLLATFAVAIGATVRGSDDSDSRVLKGGSKNDRKPDNKPDKPAKPAKSKPKSGRKDKPDEQIQKAPELVFPPADNYYSLPDVDAGDVRGPCPAINLLANHGFINRSGKEVLMTDLIEGLAAVYDVTEEFLAEGPVAGAIRNGLTTLVDGATPGSMVIADQLLDISHLDRRPGKLEHDASLVRTDDWFCDDEESKLANDDLIDALIAAGGEKSFLDRADLAAFQHERITDTVMFNNDPDSSTLPSIGGLSVQMVLIMIIGQDEVLDRIDKGRLEEFFRNERIPVDYRPNLALKYDPRIPGDFAHEVRAEFTAGISESVMQDVPEGTKVPPNSRCSSETDTVNELLV